jgi:hypothetical protein
MFKTIFLTTGTAVMALPNIGDLTTVQYNTIIAGVAYGVIDANDCDEIETCLSDGKAGATLAYSAFQQIEAGDYT